MQRAKQESEWYSRVTKTLVELQKQGSITET